MPCIRRFRIQLLFIIVAVSVSSAFAGSTEEAQPFTIDDYFKLNRIAELALSSDGDIVAYAVEIPSLIKNEATRAVYVGVAAPDAEPALIAGIQDARSLTWIPGKETLAFLSDRDGVAQVYSYDLKSKAVRRHTDSDDPVRQIAFAPNGTLAYVTQEQPAAATLHEQMRTGEKGLLVDPDVLRVQHFTDPAWRHGEAAAARRLWLAGEGGAVQLELPGDPDDFHWSRGSAELAVTYTSSEPSTSLFANYHTSVGVYNIASRQFRVLGKATTARPNAPGIAYHTDGWLGADKLIIRRAEINDLFVSPRHPEWAVVDASKKDPLAEESLTWRELSLTGHDRPPLFYVLADGSVLVNKTKRGGYRSLYELIGSAALERSEIAHDINGNVSLISFSADSEGAVFVHDGLDRPPEIYVWRRGEGAKRLTRLNQTLAERRLPIVREVNWKSEDGTPVQGWLLLPEEPTQARTPWPLITFVHGGPSLPMPVDFAGYFQRWPYPFEVYALHGMAVFLPNYRGNTTFGRAFADPKRPDTDPIRDIAGGIEHLIAQGVADPSRLAISGHSHGAWLAPLVMTRARDFNFQAGSFAEGAGNKVTVYDVTSGRLNQELHDVYYGASLYDDPKRYLRLSPVLNFEGLKTAALFEAGNKSAAIYMMSYPKAARYAGMPTEFIIYPQTGHNPTIPYIQKESATRNLDWFRFWLQGYEDPHPEKQEQYARWRKMRDERCAWDEPEDERPSYCEYSNAVH